MQENYVQQQQRDTKATLTDKGPKKWLMSLRNFGKKEPTNGERWVSVQLQGVSEALEALSRGESGASVDVPSQALARKRKKFKC